MDNPSDGGQNCLIGSYTTGYYFGNFRIARFRIWDVFLTASEIEEQSQEWLTEVRKADDGLVLHLKLDEGQGQYFYNSAPTTPVKIYCDVGSLTEADIWTNTWNGKQVATFDGTHIWVSTKEIPTEIISPTGTIAYWTWMDTAIAGVALHGTFRVFEYGGATTNYLRAGYKDDDDDIDFIIEDDNIAKISGDRWTLPIEEYTHIAVTQDGTTIRFYQNGREISNATNSWWTNHFNNAYISLGEAWGLWDGRLSDFRIYDRALSQREIKQLYESTRQPKLDDGIVLDLDFTEGSGTTTFDKSGQDNHGSLSGPPDWISGGGLTFVHSDNNNKVSLSAFTININSATMAVKYKSNFDFLTAGNHGDKGILIGSEGDVFNQFLSVWDGSETSHGIKGETQLNG
jgi:hypothetical protein